MLFAHLLREGCLAELDIPLPAHPSEAEETLALLDSYGAATMAMAGPRFFGFVVGGVLPATLAANWLASTWDQNSTHAVVTPLTAKLEDVALRWLRDVLALPPETGVGFVTGATMANFTCLAAARHTVLSQAGWDVEADGLFGAPEVTVVVGEEAHPTLFKSLVQFQATFCVTDDRSDRLDTVGSFSSPKCITSDPRLSSLFKQALRGSSRSQSK